MKVKGASWAVPSLIFFSKNKISLLTGIYGHVGHHIIYEEEKNRRRNNDLGYDTKEDELLLYCPLYVKHLEEYTKHRGREDSALNLSRKIKYVKPTYKENITSAINPYQLVGYIQLIRAVLC